MGVEINNIPWVMLDTNLIIKRFLGLGLTSKESALFDDIKKGKINVIISPINYGEIKHNSLISFISYQGALRDAFYNPKIGTGQLMVFPKAEIFTRQGPLANLLDLANAYAYDKNRQKKVPYYEYNDRLMAALAAILDIPLITADSHLLEKGRREHIKKTNKRFGIEGFYSYPVSVEEYFEDRKFFETKTTNNSSSLFELKPLMKMGAKSSAIQSTEKIVESYRGRIDASTYDQLNAILINEILNENNAESLASIEKKLLKCFNANAEFKDNNERFEKTRRASSAYMFNITAIAFFIMEYISQTQYEKGGYVFCDRKRLNEIEKSLSGFGFSLEYDGDVLVSINYKGLSFSLCRKQKHKNYYLERNILGQKINDDFKINCSVDIDKLEPATAMALIPFGCLKTSYRTEVSKKFAWGKRKEKGDYTVLSNDELAELVMSSAVGGISEKDLEDYRTDTTMTNICKTLMYLHKIEVKDKRSFYYE